jgi:hypothetical protein
MHLSFIAATTEGFRRSAWGGTEGAITIGWLVACMYVWGWGCEWVWGRVCVSVCVCVCVCVQYYTVLRYGMVGRLFVTDNTKEHNTTRMYTVLTHTPGGSYRGLRDSHTRCGTGKHCSCFIPLSHQSSNHTTATAGEREIENVSHREGKGRGKKWLWWIEMGVVERREGQKEENRGVCCDSRMVRWR